MKQDNASHMPNATSRVQLDTSLTRDILNAARYYLGGRRTLLVIAALSIVGGVALNWGWLAAIGVAPILVALLPCAVMCTLGVCMKKMRGGAQSVNKSAVGTQAKIVQAGNSPARIVGTPDLVDSVSQYPLPIATVHWDRVQSFENRANRHTFEAKPERYLTGSEEVDVSTAPAAVANAPASIEVALVADGTGTHR